MNPGKVQRPPKTTRLDVSADKRAPAAHAQAAASGARQTERVSDRLEGRAPGKMRGTVPKRYSTSTLIDSASCVPWLAAEGPLAYTPENPPATDYFFQYGWILSEIFDFKAHKGNYLLDVPRP